MRIVKMGLLSALLASACSYLSAQDCHLALRGRVLEAETLEPLAFASLFIKEIGKGTVADEYGNYAIPDLCENTAYTVEVQHIECQHQTQIIRLTENHRVDFLLNHSAVLKEVVIKEKAIGPASSQANAQVHGAELANAQGVNLGETLRRLPGVTILNAGNNVAKPVIQGLHSNRIAIVANDVVLEGQQWGADHAPEIDPFTAEKITVVKGAAGVRYGVGAIGGAVVLEPAPLREQAGWGAWLHVGGASNGLSGVAAGAADWRAPGHRLAFRLQGTLKRGGNLRAPGYWLGNTGAAESNGNLIVDWSGKRWTHQMQASSFNQQLGVLKAAHTGSLADLQLAIASDTPRNNINLFTYRIDRPYQLVRHHSFRYGTQINLSDKWKWSSKYSLQFDHRREYDVVRTNTEKPQISFQLLSNALDVALEHLPIRHWQGGVGLQATNQVNYVGKGGFIPDYLSWGGAVWATEHWRRFPVPLEFEAGLRYDYRHTHATTRGNLANLDTLVHFGSLSGTGGLIYHPGKNWTLTLNTGLAWRPPHVFELFAKGIHFAAGVYQKGDPNLQAEKAWNSQLNVQWRSAKAEAGMTLYHNRIDGYLYAEPQEQLVVTVRGAFPAYFYVQSDAVLQGIDAQFVLPLLPQLSLEGRLSMLRAYRMVTDSAEVQRREWLPLTPPDRFRYGLRWTVPEKIPASQSGQETYIALSASTVLKQVRVPATGLLAPPPAGYTVIDVEAGRTFNWKKRKIQVGLSAQNLGNLRYRDYLNFFRYFADETGVNVAIHAKLIFP